MERKKQDGRQNNGYKNYARSKETETRCLEIYYGKKDLKATWEQRSGWDNDPDYMRSLRGRVFTARARAKQKGLEV